MRIGVLGAGAVGGVFGARLARAGADVTFLARGAHAAAIRRDGLRVRSDAGELRVEPARVALPGEGAGPFDLVLLAVKAYDLEPAAAALLPRLHAASAVVPLQNGVEARDAVRRALPGAVVHGGVAYVAGHVEAPGTVRQVGGFARLLFGAEGGGRPPELVELERSARAAGLDAELSPDIGLEIWRKFCFLAPFAGITALARAPIGAVRDDPGLWARFAGMVGEAVALGRARGVALPEGLAEERVAFAAGLPAAMKSSLLVDLEAGRRLELDGLLGAVVRLGRAAGVPVPASAATLAAIEAELRP